MAKRLVFDELDLAVDRMIAGHGLIPSNVDDDIREMLDSAAELRMIASADFKARLKSDLLEVALLGSVSVHRQYSQVFGRVANRATENAEEVLPTLFASGYGNYPVRRVNFAASLLLHAAALLLVVSSGLWMAQKSLETRPQVISVLTDPGANVVPPAPEKAGGGGGGGDADRLRASNGSPPRFAHEQLTPPAVVVRNVNPRLSAEPTVVGPPSLTLPQTAQIGDPLSSILSPPSNGTGIGGGIGSGSGGGVGSGRGPGVGLGWGGGIGGGPYRVGGGVSAPRPLYTPDPEYSDEARRAQYQGTAVLWVVVGADGRPHEIRVARALGMGLDEKAIQAVRKWRFEPARKDGRPVAVQMNVEVSFRLY